MRAAATADSGTRTAMSELRSATWPCHQRLEKRLDVKQRFSELSAYRAHLEKMWGFCTGIESRVGPGTFGDALPDFCLRLKTPLLHNDLVALGADAASVTRLPRCETLPAVADRASAFGCIYVLEGATLGGRTLMPMVQNRLALTADHGAAFLASYGENVGSMWDAFKAAVDAWCRTPEPRARAAEAAVATFASLDRWLCGEPQ